MKLLVQHGGFNPPYMYVHVNTLGNKAALIGGSVNWPKEAARD